MSGFKRVFLDRLLYFWIGDDVGRTGADERFRGNDCVQRKACFSSGDGVGRTGADGRSVTKTVLNSRLVLGIRSFGRVSGDSAVALRGDWLSRLVYRLIRCRAAL